MAEIKKLWLFSYSFIKDGKAHFPHQELGEFKVFFDMWMDSTITNQKYHFSPLTSKGSI